MNLIAVIGSQAPMLLKTGLIAVKGSPAPVMLVRLWKYHERRDDTPQEAAFCQSPSNGVSPSVGQPRGGPPRTTGGGALQA